MSALADMLAKHSGPSPSYDDDSPEPDAHKLGMEALKSCYESAQKGDWESAWADFQAACEHAEKAEMGPADGGGHALLVIGHK